MDSIYISFFTFIFLSFYLLPLESAETPPISDLRLCADPECSVPISLGLAQVNYFSNNKYGVSFKRGSQVTVFSKSAGTRQDLWGVMVNGKRGYAPKNLITEKKILVRNEDLKHIVPTEISVIKETVTVTEADEEVSANEDTLITENVEVVKNTITGGSLFSSFILPGSVAAEGSVSQDVKNKIDPKKVEPIVIDGTTIAYNADVPYMDDHSHLDNDLKPAESLIMDTEKDPSLSQNQPDLDSAKTEDDSVDNSSTEAESSPKEQNDIDSVPSIKVPSLNDELNKNKDSIKQSSQIVDDLPKETETVQKTESDFLSAKLDNLTDDDEEIFENEDADEEPYDYGDEEVEEESDEQISIEKLNNDAKEDKVTDEEIQTEGESSDSVLSDQTSLQNETNSSGSISIDDTINEESQNVSDVAQELDAAVEDVDQTLVEKVKDQISQPTESDIPDDTVSLKNVTDQIAESLDNTSGIIKESLKPPSPVEGLNQFFERPEIKSELRDSLLPKGQDENEKHAVGNTSSISSFEADLPLEKLESGTSNIVNKIDIKLSNTSEHFDSVTAVESDLSVEDKTKVSDESTTFQPIEITEDPFDLQPPTDFPSNEVKKDVEETVEVSTQSSIDITSLPILPPILRQHESNVQKTYDTLQAEVDELQQEAPVQEPGIVNDEKEESIPLEEKEESIPLEEKEESIPLEEKEESIPLEEKEESIPLEEEQETVSSSEVKELHVPATGEDTIPSEEPDGVVVESEKWFSFDFISNLFSSMSQPSPDTIDVVLPEEKLEDAGQPALIATRDSIPQQEYCSADNGMKSDSCIQFESVKEDDNNVSDAEDKEIGSSWDVVKELLSASENVSVSSDSLLYLIITAVSVILFSLGYYYIENHRNDNALVAKINKLERDYLVVKKESVMLQDKLQTAESQVSLSHDSLTEFNEQIAALTQELEEVKAAKIELEEQYVILEKEFDAATESGLEMHRLLTESLSTQDGSQVLLKTVESLRMKLDHQDGENKELKKLLGEKSEEIERLKEEMKINHETRKAVQEKLTNLRREKEEEVLQLKDSNRTLSTQLGDLTEEKSLLELKLSNEISRLRLLVEETQTTLADRESEIDSLKEAIAKLNKHEKEENLDALYDTAKVSSKLVMAERERDNYKEKFFEEEGARKLLEAHVQTTRQEVKSLKENYETAEKEKIEALTKLQVLSNYFKEKESQLQKELGLQESMWLQKQSDDHTIYEQMKSLREENEKYKLQNESLKKEICESESAFKIQIANAEQKAHDNWLASRQIERRLKESQNDAMQLRNRLTLVEKNANNSSTDDLKQNMSYSIGETNGDPSSPPPNMPLFPPTTSPPFMMFGGSMPPPPPHPTSEFLPPPPLSFPEGRPAPVGRISSPPLDHSFSPPPPLTFFYDPSGYGGHHSPSPPPHRPMPKPIREMGMEQKDRNSPPRHSEQQERPGRRSKR